MIQKQIKSAVTGILALSAVTGFLVPSTASAAQVSGVASITIDNTAVLASKPDLWYYQNFWGTGDETQFINSNATGGTTLSSSGTNTQNLAVNSNLTTSVSLAPCTLPSCNPVPGVHYGRTLQATTMDNSEALLANGNGKQIGLNGSYRMKETSNTPTYLVNSDLSLRKYGTEWNILSYDSGFNYANMFRLGNVSESLDGLGNLVLTGDLFWSAPFAGGNLSWSQLFPGSNLSLDLGDFNLSVPAAPVPVPAAAWLFGGSLATLFASIRRKSSTRV